MSNPVKTLMGRAAVAAGVVLLFATAAHAQKPLGDPPTTPEFMSRMDLGIMIAAISGPDPDFSWDTRAGGEFDIVDYVHGRATVTAIYQAVLGSEFRPFDPNQGNYTLDASGSARIDGTEIVGVFHHLSRHLSDRPKRFAIAYNSIGPRVMREFDVDGTIVDVKGDVMAVIGKSYVDYTWLGSADLGLERPVAPRVHLFVNGTVNIIGVDPEIAGRTTQRGGRAEAGVRFDGTAGALEFFGGVERVIDADPIIRGSLRWAFVGFRVLSR